MAPSEFDVAKRRFSARHNNGARARRFALDPSKAAWYSVYRMTRFATRGLPEHDEAAASMAMWVAISGATKDRPFTEA